MRKNIIITSIVGMLLLSSFVTISSAEDEIITITISDICPANESKEIDTNILTVSVHIEATKQVSQAFPQYLDFHWKINGDNITTSEGDSNIPITVSADIKGPLKTNKKINWYVNITAFDEKIEYYKNESFWFITFNQPPVADFKNITHGLKVEFNGTSSYDIDGTIENYTWYFGDGSVGYRNMTQHVFNDNGTYFVSLNVTDDGGKSDNKTVLVNVENVTNDTTSPTVKITKPERAFYIANKKIRRLFLRMAFVIGSITVEVNASDSGSGIERVEFYVNGKLKENKTTAPYTFNWTKDRLVRFVHIQVLKVVAYDKYGNSASDFRLVKKFL